MSLSRRSVLASTAALAITGTARAEDTAADMKKLGPGLVLGRGPAGWWDSERVSCPRVIREANGTWKMWYYGREPSFDKGINLPDGRVGMATSKDGITWTRVKGPLTMGSVLEPSSDPKRFDSGHVGVSGVHRDGNQYVMWYHGGDQSILESPRGKSKGFPLRAGRATSPDGLTWTKTDGPHRGAMLDVGAPGSYDSFMTGWPHVLKEEDGSYKLYYHTVSMTEGFMACLAVSPDGMKWEKVGPVLKKGGADDFDAGGVATRHVIKHQGRYYMIYEGNSGGPRFPGIGLAESNDGITFKKVRGPEDRGCVLPTAPKGSGRFDAGGIGTPWVVPLPNGSFHLYYVGATEVQRANPEEFNEHATTHRIGLAVSDGPDLTRWRRWEG
jgi:hypothetical protein